MATRLYVGNLPYTASEQQLTEMFSAFGEVVEVRIVTDRDSGRSKGFAFVEMSTDAAARAAIDGLNGTLLGDRALTVNEARPRPERSSGYESRGGYDRRPRRNDRFS
jgi:RNA recognition motif-containing protein